MNQIYLGDCLEWMPLFPDHSFDMILCDLPYGTTACKWDVIIPFEPLWEQYKRIIKPRGAIVLTASQPFTSKLVMSNIAGYKYSWTWVKSVVTGFQNAKIQPLRAVEDVLVFNAGIYYPQGLTRIDKVAKNSLSCGGAVARGDVSASLGKGNLRTPGSSYVQEFTGYPRNVLEIPSNSGSKIHPTQKPVALFEYLIRTYTQPGELVLDNCAGSGTTGVACINTGRRFVLIEREEKYHEICVKRCAEAEEKIRLTGAWCPR